MKKLLFLLVAMLIVFVSQAQTVIWHENFEPPSAGDSVTSSGTPQPWAVNTRIWAGGTACDSNYVQASDTSFLTTGVINCTGYGSVILKFSHICKIESSDGGVIEVSVNNGPWTQLTGTQYINPGSSQFVVNANKFNAYTYIVPNAWDYAVSNSKPQNSWFMPEQFDISALAGNQANVRIRFALRDGTNNGANYHAGWFIDNIQVVAAVSELIPPTVVYKTPIIQDTVTYVGPFDIYAYIKDASGIDTAWLTYTVNGGSNNYLPMTWVSDSTYKATIPAHTWNTSIAYYVHAEDNSGSHNATTAATKTFYIKKAPPVVIIGTGTSNTYWPFYVAWGYTRSAAVYTAAEIGQTGSIQKLAWNVATASTVNDPVKIYLKVVGSTTLASDTWANLIAGATLVYNSTTPISPTGWKDFTLSTPFSYAGGNLLVLVESNYGGGGTSPSGYCYYTTTSGYQHENFYADNTPPTGTGNLSYSRPNLRVSFQATSYMFDAGVTSVSYPTGTVIPGTNVPVTVTVKNFSDDTLNTIKVKYSVDGVIRDSIGWSGVLYAGLSTPAFNIDTTNFTLGQHTIKAWTSKPNGSADQAPANDTASSTFYVCSAALAGSYTIGSGGDFATISAAVQSMSNCGISGAVVFNIMNGTYTEQVTIPVIGGASATNTITFRPAAGATVTLTSGGTNSTLIFNGADYVIFDGSNNGTTSRNMIISNTSTTGSQAAVQFTSLGNGAGSTYCTIKNCNLSTGSISNTTYGVSIGAAVGSSGADNDFITIRNNNISKAYYGIWASATTSNPNDSLKIVGNTIGSTTASDYISWTGIYAAYANASLISGNTIFNILSSNGTVCGINAGTGFLNSGITKNNIKAIKYTGTGGYGGRGIYVNTGSATSNLDISNNMIAEIGGDGYSSFGNSSPVGMFFDGTTGALNIYHNSVYMSGNMTYSSGSLSAAILFNASTVTAVKCQNNIFMNTMNNTASASYKQYAIYSSAPATSFTTINNNVYYVSGAQTVLGYLASDRATLAAWQTATTQDAASVNTDPLFISTSNLHTYCISINNVGAACPTVTTDIDGDPRNATTPDPGADEFAPLADDIEVQAILAPNSGCNYNNEIVQIRIKNAGGSPLTSADLYYRVNGGAPVHEVFSGSIASNTTYVYSFTTPVNLSTAGNYVIDAWGSMASDINKLNDTIKNHTFYSGYNFGAGSYTMGFETGNNYSDWSFLDVNADSRTWQFPYAGASYAHSGTNCARFYNSSTVSGNDWLFTRCFTVTTGTTYKVEFWYKVDNVAGPQNITLKYGNSATPAGMTNTLLTLAAITNTNYQKASVTFTATANASVFFGWLASSNPSAYNAYIDDINISIMPDQEATAVSLIAPVTGCGLSSTSPVTLKIRNTGAQPVNGNLTAYYKINNTAPVSQSVSSAIAVGDSLNFTFTQTANLGVTTHDSTFAFKAWIALTGDPMAYNDTVNATVISKHIPLAPVVVNDTIAWGTSTTLHATAVDTVLWYSAATGGSLLHVGPNYTTPLLYNNAVYYPEAAIYSPAMSYTVGTGTSTMTYPFYTYDQDARTQMIFTAAEITAAGGVSRAIESIAFNISSNSTQTMNGFNIRMQNTSLSSLSGFVETGWTTVYSGTYAVPGTGWQTITLQTPFLWDGTSNLLVGVCYDNSSYTTNTSVYCSAASGKTWGYATDGSTGCTMTGGSALSNRPNIRFGAAASIGCASARIPDTVFMSLFPWEEGLTAISAPVAGCSHGTENVSLTVINNGANAITTFNATYQAGTATPVTETFNVNIDPDSSATVTFTTPLVTGISSSNIDTAFSLSAWINLASDVVTFNDTLRGSYSFTLIPDAPTTTTVTVPYGTAATVHAVAADTIVWYDAASGGNQLHVGSAYTTPLNYGTTLYWAQASRYRPPVDITVGTGTSSSSYPFYSFYHDSRCQMIFTASELTALGATSGAFEKIAFDVTAASSQVLNGFTISMQNTSMSSLTAFVETGWTTVYSGNYTVPGTGWQEIALQTPFTWDGTSNLLISICFDNTSYTSSSTVNSSTVSGLVWAYRTDGSTGCTMTGGSAQTIRPNIRLSAAEFIGCSSDRVADTVFVSGAPACDMSVVSMSSPVSGIELTNSEDVIVVLHNYGSAPATNVPVSYSINGVAHTETIAGPIASGADYNYTFVTPADLSVAGTYNIDVYTGMLCDTIHINDTVSVTVVNSPLLYCSSGATSTYDNDIGNVTFANINNGVANPILNNATCVNTYTDFTSVPAANIIAGSTVPISVTKIEDGSYFYDAKVNVYIDWNRNGSWDLPGELVFTAQTGYDESFPTVSGAVSVPTTGVVTGQNLRMRIVLDESDVAPACGTYTWGETEDYFVVVTPQSPKDAGVISIVTPIATQGEGDVVPVEVVIKNFGSDTIKNSSNMYVKYSLNGQAPVSTLWANGNIASGATAVIDLPNVTIPAGYNNICVWTELPLDPNFNNDTNCKAVYGTPNVDAGVSVFVQPSNLTGFQGGSGTVEVVVVNHGSDTLTSIPVKYSVNGAVQATQTWTGILAPGATTNFLFTTNYVIPASSYSLCAFTSLTGDGNHTNDTACIHPYGLFTSTIPYYDNFDGATVNFMGTADANGNVWELGTPAYGTTNSAYSAPNAWDVNLTTPYTNYAAAYLYTQNFDFTGAINAKLSFWINVDAEPNWDGLTMEYSIDSSNTWTRLGDVSDPLGVNWYTNDGNGGPSWESTGGWIKAEYLLTAFNNLPTVRFRYYFHSDGSGINSGASVDNFSISVPSPIDAGVEAIKLPTGFAPSGSSKTVKVLIRNFGTDTLSSIPLSYVVNSGTPVNATWTGQLAPNDTIAYTFPTPFIVPGGAYTLCSYTSLTADGDHLNDTTCKSLTGVVTFTVPYTDNMEGTVYWFGDGGNSSWEWGVPASTTINFAHSPTHCWKTNLDGYYSNNSNDYLYTPYFDFTQVADANLEFWHWYQTEANTDGGKIEYTLNSGATWITLGYMGDPAATNWYNSTIGGTGYWAGNGAGWVFSSYDLGTVPAIVNATAPVQFRYKFYSSASGNSYDGWAVDDFTITAPPIPKDAGVSEILAPSAATMVGSPVTVQVKIKNYGTDTLMSVPVAYAINGGAYTQETWTGNLNPADSANFTFTTTFASPSNTYNLCAFTKKVGDTYKFNDTTCMSVNTFAAPDDAGCIAVLAPGDSTIYGDSIAVTIRIKNFGTNTLTSIPVQYTRNAIVMSNETWTGSLASGATADYTFHTKYASPLSYYQLCGVTLLPGDADATNDKTCVSPIGYVGMGEYSGEDFFLWQNVPNPANGISRIEYQIPHSGQVKFEVRNIVGQVMTVNSESAASGRNYVELNVSKWAAGIYYYSVEFEGQRLTRKMVVSQ
jgi:hypothetical protein